MTSFSDQGWKGTAVIVSLEVFGQPKIIQTTSLTIYALSETVVVLMDQLWIYFSKDDA